jgi:hypothetical protein
MKISVGSILPRKLCLDLQSVCPKIRLIFIINLEFTLLIYFYLCCFVFIFGAIFMNVLISKVGEDAAGTNICRGHKAIYFYHGSTT